MIGSAIPLIARQNAECGTDLSARIDRPSGGFARELEAAGHDVGHEEHTDDPAPKSENTKDATLRPSPGKSPKEKSSGPKSKSTDRTRECTRHRAGQKPHLTTDTAALSQPECLVLPEIGTPAGANAEGTEESLMQVLGNAAGEGTKQGSQEASKAEATARNLDTLSGPKAEGAGARGATLGSSELAFAAKVATAVEAEAEGGQGEGGTRKDGTTTHEWLPESLLHSKEQDSAMGAAKAFGGGLNPIEAVGSSGAPRSAGSAPAGKLETAAKEQTVQDIQPTTPITLKQGALREVALHLAGSVDQRVEVRLTERAGELRVSVRTSDSELRQGLRDNLSDLVGRLGETGYRGETWRPPEARMHSETSTHDQGSPNGGWGGNQGQRDARQDADRPAWVQELEDGSKPSSKRSVPWLQVYSQ